MATNKTLIVIPYLASEAQGNELELAVTGWRRHFRTAHQILVIGDWHPITETGRDILFSPCPRIDPVPGQYLPHLDIKNKFLRARELFPRTKGFVFTCDDCYPVRDFTLADIMTPKIARREIPKKDWRNESPYLKDYYKTRDVLDLFRLPIYDFDTHLPRWYDFRRLLATYNAVRDHESYVWSNLYYNFEVAVGNIAIPEDAELCTPHCRWKHEVKSAHPGFSDVRDTEAVWIVNGNCGWSAELEELLRWHYNNC